MEKIIKFFKRKMYLIGGLLYLAGVSTGFILMLSSVAKAINFSLPGGSEVSVPQIVFNIEGYKKIQHIVGVVLEEAPLETPSPTGQEPLKEESVVTMPATTTESESAKQATSTEVEAEELVLDKAAISLRVLNGSGVTGAASSVRSIFEAEGFIVSKVGNTQKTAKSRLEIKDSKNDYAALIVEAIADTHTVHEITSLAETEEVDAVFIIGVE